MGKDNTAIDLCYQARIPPSQNYSHASPIEFPDIRLKDENADRTQAPLYRLRRRKLLRSGILNALKPIHLIIGWILWLNGKRFVSFPIAIRGN